MVIKLCAALRNPMHFRSMQEVHRPLLVLPSSVLPGLSAERSLAAAPRISFTAKAN